jgi:hypothetical protein
VEQTEAATTAAAPAQQETCFQVSLQGCVCSAAAAGARCADSPDDFNDSVVVVILIIMKKQNDNESDDGVAFCPNRLQPAG